MSGHIVLSCDCTRCCEIGPGTTLHTAGWDISSARTIARSETRPDDQRWTGDGEFDYAPGHEQAERDGTNREFVRVEERAVLIRTVMLDRFPPVTYYFRCRPSWQELGENDKEYYRELARQELLADRKRVRGLG
jgi:hypothetical protein